MFFYSVYNSENPELKSFFQRTLSIQLIQNGIEGSLLNPEGSELKTGHCVPTLINILSVDI